MTDDNVPSTRIGTAERDSAMTALDTHLQAGRLDAEEYGERAGRISVARTVSDLEPLFSDLPAPHPVIGTPPHPSAPAPQPYTNAPRPPASPYAAPARFGGTGRDDREPLGGRVGATIVALSPFIALILFFATNSAFSSAWLFFLLVPAAGAIVYGGKWRGE